MQRRTLLALAPLGLVFSSSVTFAESEHIVNYTREAYDLARTSGKPLLLDFSSKS